MKFCVVCGVMCVVSCVFFVVSHVMFVLCFAKEVNSHSSLSLHSIFFKTLLSRCLSLSIPSTGPIRPHLHYLEVFAALRTIILSPAVVVITIVFTLIMYRISVNIADVLYFKYFDS
jgi:hypothetical protein